MMEQFLLLLACAAVVFWCVFSPRKPAQTAMAYAGAGLGYLLLAGGFAFGIWLIFLIVSFLI